MAETFLGFDHGSKHIGVAVGQSLTATATPLRSVAVRQAKPDWETLDKLVREWRPGALVVGLPLHEDGSASPASEAAERFGRQLRERYRLPVHMIDEYLSSHAAAERTRGELHPVAAQITLETWFTHAAHAHPG